jgi:hypothetical protein
MLTGVRESSHLERRKPMTRSLESPKRRCVGLKEPLDLGNCREHIVLQGEAASLALLTKYLQAAFGIVTSRIKFLRNPQPLA